MITIMTPTYNRAYILKEAYNSLKRQSSFEFEWIVVDDGSTDETEEIVRRWVEEEKNFSIVYEKQKNGGKHRAVNKGVSLAKYDYFLILDSDDRLTKNAVTLIHTWIAEITDLNGFAGVAGLRGNINTVIEETHQKKYIDATNLERQKFNIFVEQAEVYKTEILRKYPFPEFDGENFIRESAVWDRIAKDGWKLRWHNEIVYLWDYIEDGLTKNTSLQTYVKNFLGFTYCVKLFLETHGFMPSLNKCGEFRRVAKMKGIKLVESAKLLGTHTTYFVIGIWYYRVRQLVKFIFAKKARK